VTDHDALTTAAVNHARTPEQMHLAGDQPSSSMPCVGPRKHLRPKRACRSLTIINT